MEDKWKEQAKVWVQEFKDQVEAERKYIDHFYDLRNAQRDAFVKALTEMLVFELDLQDRSRLPTSIEIWIDVELKKLIEQTEARCYQAHLDGYGLLCKPSDPYRGTGS